MDQYSREFIAEKARLRPEDLGLVRTARRSHNQLGLAYQIAFIRLTGRAPGQQPFEILEDLVGYVATELNANPRDLDLGAPGALGPGHLRGRCQRDGLRLQHWPRDHGPGDQRRLVQGHPPTRRLAVQRGQASRCPG